MGEKWTEKKSPEEHKGLELLVSTSDNARSIEARFFFFSVKHSEMAALHLRYSSSGVASICMHGCVKTTYAKRPIGKRARHLGPTCTAVCVRVRGFLLFQ
jgi:hypothetical protein